MVVAAGAIMAAQPPADSATRSAPLSMRGFRFETNVHGVEGGRDGTSMFRTGAISVSRPFTPAAQRQRERRFKAIVTEIDERGTKVQLCDQPVAARLAPTD